MDIQLWLISFLLLITTFSMNNTKFIKVYLATMLILTISVLYLLKDPIVSREKSIIILVIFIVVGYTNIKLRITYQNILKEKEEHYRGLVESSLIGVFIIKNKRLIYINPYLEHLLGYSLEDLQDIDVINLFHGDDELDVFNTLNSGPNKSLDDHYQFRIHNKYGDIIHVEISFAFLNDENSVSFIGTVLDITKQKKAEEQIRHMAYYDALTSLPNRHMLTDYLSQRIVMNKANNHRVAVIFIDLDRFKLINDTLGHNYGDKLLQETALRLKSCIGQNDIVSRYGGDEFVIIIDNTDENSVSQISNRIVSQFVNPFKLGSREVYTTPSIGISFYPEDGQDVDTLIKNADTAMYRAKDNGKNNYQFYTMMLNKEVSRKMDLQTSLRKALDKNEFVLHYQPQFDLKSGLVYGLEALLRWESPSNGLVSPLEFIPLCEETGLIISIGEWVIDAACRQNKIWKEAGYPFNHIAVNVSAIQLKHPGFYYMLTDTLKKLGMDPQHLVLEVTESVMQDLNTSVVINKLISSGIRVAIDDFGTGYSSLRLLKNVKPSIIKIDPSFTRDIIKNNDSLVILKHILNMGHELNCIIIAEGIEYEQQVSLLNKLGCDIGQGYLFSKPLPGESIKKFFDDKLLTHF
ncbi:putative bifunctional diguanylate cyclase/phosphodiesterase [Pseudobacteroides cellulosolvens]|nr:EAL domain-containing protein [Pseudobacteroides cellulosolvens]